MFGSALDDLTPWEMSPEVWEAQLADLISRDRSYDEAAEPLLDAARLADDDPWLEEPLACALDDASADPAALSDTAIIDTIRALQHHLDRAGARQARLLAEFTRRRPTPTTPDTPRAATFSRWAPDEISLALSLSRITALNQLAQAVMLRDVLPDVLDAWEHGLIDVLKVRAICDACLRVPVDHAAHVAARVLPRADTQTVAQLRESLKRAVIAVDPDGANHRHTEQTKKRRVKLYPEEDGMATLAAYLTAPQAITAHGWLTALARGLGKDDPRTMDERRADLFAALATGNLTIIAPTDGPTDGHSDNKDDNTDDDGLADTGATGCDMARAGDDTDGGMSSRSDSTGHGGADSETTDTPDGETTDGDAGTDNVAAPETGPAEQAADEPASAGDPESRPPAERGSTPAAGRASRSDSERSATPSPTPSPSPPVPVPRGPAGMPQPVHPGKPLVHVLVPITTLYGADHHPVELVGYGPIPAALACDIAADAIWKRLVTDPLSGTLLDHGRHTYRPPAATAEFVRARDVHCRFPTCRRRALDSELDHTQAWTADHGDTSDENLYDACPHHHHVKHDGPGWTVSQDPDATITWTTPTGHRYTSQPYDYRPEPELPDTARTAPTAKREQPERDPRSPFDRDPDPDAVDDAPFCSTTSTVTHPPRPAVPTDPVLQRNLRRITRTDGE